MLTFKFLGLKVGIKFRLLPLDNSHELVYFGSETIEIGSVHAIVRVIHEVFKDPVDNIFIVSNLEDIFAKIVHSLQVPNIGIVKAEG